MCEILHAAEFHHFTRRGETLLFDVGALSVIDSCELDRVLLDAAAEAKPAAELFGRAVAAGFDPVGTRLRLLVLREQRFLLASDEPPRRTARGNVRADCRGCWSRNLCAGGPPSDCAAIRAESEIAIAVYARWRSDP